jgi:uncharacterized protein YhbP (UPF0306 family)
MDKDLLKFIQSQKVLTIATVDSSNLPWVSNVYYSATDKGELFFISATTTNHSQHLLKQNQVAFSTVWYDPKNMEDRKSIQGKGTCERVTNILKMTELITNHLKFYPDWKDFLTTEAVLKELIEYRPYVIKPSYMKFWSDELFGEDAKEFNFV